jgi:hypothetical protein
MLIIRIELHSAVTGKVTTVATGKIVNTGTGTPTRGNYRIDLRDAAGRPWRAGTLEGFPRKRLLAWDLLYRALEKLVGSRNPTPNSPRIGSLSSEGTDRGTHDKGTDNDRTTAEPERDPQSP